jgi:hypothetical protein
VVEALARVVCPVTVRVDAVVVARVEVPVTAKSPVVVALIAVRLLNAAVITFRMLAKKLDDVAFVVEALVAKNVLAVAFVRLALFEKSDVTVPTVVDEVLRTVWPDTVRAVAEALARVVCPVTPKVPATPRRKPGVVEPIPTFPLERIVKSDAPVEEATLNGLRAVEVEDCTLNAKVDDVALIPATVPLSRSVDVPRVDAVSQRVAKPRAPPDTPTAVTPRVEVDTHFVVVPVVWRIIPRVPVLFVES